MSCIQLPWDDIDQLERDGFRGIIQKVIFKVGKIRFSPFSHYHWYYSIVTKCRPNLLNRVASLLWNQSCLKIWNVWNHSKGQIQGQKVQFGPVWSISANISETVHRMMKVWPFSLPYKIWPWMTLIGQIKVIKFSTGCFS